MRIGSEPTGPATSEGNGSGRHLVVTVHGIRTYGDWQERLERLVLRRLGSGQAVVENYKYDYFSVIGFIVPFMRWLVVMRFRKYLTRLIRRDNWSRIDLVGHSFGTHILAWAVRGMPKNTRPKVHTILLAGSVLKAKFRWSDLDGYFLRVVNDCGSRDIVLFFNQLLVLGTGMAGRVGFVGGTNTAFRNRFHTFGHGGYFRDADGSVSDDWMKKFWLPIIAGDSEIRPYDEREPPTIVEGVLHTIARNAEPIKILLFVIFPLVLGFVWIAGLYLEAAEQTRSALSHYLSAEALRMGDNPKDIDGRFYKALLLATEATSVSEGPECSTADLSSLANASCFLDRLRLLVAQGAGSRDHAPEGFLDRLRSAIGVGVKTSPDPNTLGTLVRLLQRWEAHDGTFVPRHVMHGSSLIYRIAISADGKRFVTLALIAEKERHASVMQVWDIATGRSMGDPVPLADGTYYSVTPHKTGFALLNARSRWPSSLTLRDVETNRLIGEPLRSPVFGDVLQNTIAFSPSGRWLAIADMNRRVRLWDVSASKLLKEIDEPLDRTVLAVTGLAVSDTGNRLAIGRSDGTIELRVADTGVGITNLAHGKGPVRSIAFSFDGKWLASAHDGAVWLRGLAISNPVASRLPSAKAEVTDVVFNLDGSMLAGAIGFLGAYDLHVWNAASLQLLGKPLRGHMNKVRSVRFSRDGKNLVSADDNGTVIVWERVVTPLSKSFLRAQSKGSFDRTFGRLATSGADGSLWIWSPGSGGMEKRLLGHAHSVIHLSFSPDGKRLAAGIESGAVQLWNVEKGERDGSPLHGPGRVSRVSFGARGKSLRVLYSYGALWDWDIETRKPTRKRLLERNGIDDAAFSDDGSIVFVIAEDESLPLGENQRLRLWDVAVGRVLAEPIVGHRRHIWSVAITPDGKMMASASADGIVRFWKPDSRRLVPSGELKAFAGEDVLAVAFSPNGRTLATASDREVQLWDVLTRTALGSSFSLRGRGPVWLAFSADGTRLTAGGPYRGSHLWNLAWRNQACRVARRNLTRAEWDDYVRHLPYRFTCRELSDGHVARVAPS